MFVQELDEADEEVLLHVVEFGLAALDLAAFLKERVEHLDGLSEMVGLGFYHLHYFLELHDEHSLVDGLALGDE